MKILIVDDHALFRAGLRMLLGTIGQNVECLEAANVSERMLSVWVLLSRIDSLTALRMGAGGVFVGGVDSDGILIGATG